jgi:hypothetical protein
MFQMQILLSPSAAKPAELRDVYKRAFDEAEELYIASAYLTDWDSGYKLSTGCKRVIFLVGTDFGLTRKAAMLNVLRWIPKHASFFGAVPPQDGGFHPKIVAWKAHSGEHYCLIGSSNLSKAAFSSNYEANLVTHISSRDFGRLRTWLNSLCELSSPVSEDWIEHHYTEAHVMHKGKQAGISILQIAPSDFPSGPACEQAVRDRRQQQAAFVAEIGKPIRAAAVRCSQGKISNNQFWQTFWELWGNHPSRFQGSGLQFTGKSAKWGEACRSLIRILDASTSSPRSQLDNLVIKEIDHLGQAGIPVRRAWLSEMLCHYLPELYPISNKPVDKWLSTVRLHGRRGMTGGERYVDLARKLRLAVQNYHPAGSRNLAELDYAIWQWAHDHGLLKS